METVIIIMETMEGTERLAILQSELETAKHILNTLKIDYRVLN